MAVNERRVRFLADYDYRPKQGITIAYKAGWAGLVRKECADRAVVLGKAERVTVAGPPAGIAATIARKGRRGRKVTTVAEADANGPPT